VLDPWYNVTLPSQRTAEAFDLRCKAIDREAGDIHNPCPSAAQIAAVFRAQGGFRIDYTLRLIVQDVPIARLEEIARVQLDRIGRSAAATAELARIRERVQAEGMTEVGALCLTAIKESIMPTHSESRLESQAEGFPGTSRRSSSAKVACASHRTARLDTRMAFERTQIGRPESGQDPSREHEEWRRPHPAPSIRFVPGGTDSGLPTPAAWHARAPYVGRFLR